MIYKTVPINLYNYEEHDNGTVTFGNMRSLVSIYYGNRKIAEFEVYNKKDEQDVQEFIRLYDKAVKVFKK